MPTCWRPAAWSSPAVPTPSAATSRCAARTWATEETDAVDLLLHQVLSGLATGGIYASVALALVMIYQATHLVNFAQGELAMFSTYLAWTLMQAGLPSWAAFFVTVGSAFVGGVAIVRLIIRPVGQAPILAGGI